jgi:hypothetical protein
MSRVNGIMIRNLKWGKEEIKHDGQLLARREYPLSLELTPLFQNLQGVKKLWRSRWENGITVKSVMHWTYLLSFSSFCCNDADVATLEVCSCSFKLRGRSWTGKREIRMEITCILLWSNKHNKHDWPFLDHWDDDDSLDGQEEHWERKKERQKITWFHYFHASFLNVRSQQWVWIQLIRYPFSGGRERKRMKHNRVIINGDFFLRSWFCWLLNFASQSH